MSVLKPLMALDASQEMWNSVPGFLQEGLARYLDHGEIPGSFLTSCLSNDLVGAACRAHPALRLEDLRTLMQFLFTGAPSGSWGNKEKVEAWRNHPMRLRVMNNRKEPA